MPDSGEPHEVLVTRSIQTESGRPWQCTWDAPISVLRMFSNYTKLYVLS